MWDAASPALLIGGGSGVVPLMAILRLARAAAAETFLRLLVSVRSPDELYYRDELVATTATIVNTRAAPLGHARPPGRVRAEDLAPLVSAEATVYVCGSNGFADAMTAHLDTLGVDASRIRVERFGPT